MSEVNKKNKTNSVTRYAQVKTTLNHNSCCNHGGECYSFTETAFSQYGMRWDIGMHLNVCGCTL